MRITARQKIKHFCKERDYKLYERYERYEAPGGAFYCKTVRIEDGDRVLENKFTYDNIWVIYRELAQKYLGDGVKEKRIV